MEASLKEDGGALDYEIVKFYPDVEGNDVAKKLIIDTLKRDLNELRDSAKVLSASLKRLKEKK